MTPTDRDRLVALKKAASGAITQRQAAVELDFSERQVRRLLVKLRGGGDKAILHGLRQRRSNEPEQRRRIRSASLYRHIFRHWRRL
jgi:hypothetical protein